MVREPTKFREYNKWWHCGITLRPKEAQGDHEGKEFVVKNG